MFSTAIVNSDPFLDMPASTQSLYFHLGLHCDDDGFVYPKKVMRLVNAGDDDLKILISKKFVLPFESGVTVIKHWRENNYIRSDRYRQTTHKEELGQLVIENRVYHLDTTGIPTTEKNGLKYRYTTGIPSGNIRKEGRKEGIGDIKKYKPSSLQ